MKAVGMARTREPLGQFFMTFGPKALRQYFDTGGVRASHSAGRLSPDLEKIREALSARGQSTGPLGKQSSPTMQAFKEAIEPGQRQRTFPGPLQGEEGRVARNAQAFSENRPQYEIPETSVGLRKLLESLGGDYMGL